MNDVAVVARRHGEDVDLGHPVRSFILVMVAVGVGLVVLQLSGAVVPRMSSSHGASNAFPGGQLLQAEVTNDGPMAVDVIGARWPVENGDALQLGVLPEVDDRTGNPILYGLKPFAPFTLQPGESGWIGLAVQPLCGDAQVGPLEVDVQAPIGVDRTIEFEYQEQIVSGTC